MIQTKRMNDEEEVLSNLHVEKSDPNPPESMFIISGDGKRTESIIKLKWVKGVSQCDSPIKTKRKDQLQGKTST